MSGESPAPGCGDSDIAGDDAAVPTELAEVGDVDEPAEVENSSTEPPVDKKTVDEKTADEKTADEKTADGGAGGAAATVAAFRSLNMPAVTFPRIPELAVTADWSKALDPLAGVRNSLLINKLRTQELMGVHAVKMPKVDVTRVQTLLAAIGRWKGEPPVSKIADAIAASKIWNPTLNPAIAWSDKLVPAALVGAQRQVTADLAAVLTGPSALTGWREALAAHTTLTSALAAGKAASIPRSPAGDGALASIRALSLATSVNVQALGPWAKYGESYGAIPLAAASLGSFRRWLDNSYDSSRARTAMHSSYGVSGATAAQVLLLDDGDADEETLAVVEEVADDVGNVLVQPWQSAREGAAARLHTALAQLDEALVDVLLGAWAETQRPGPGQLVKLAACAVETIDRTLRAAAPEDRVRAWIYKTELVESKTVSLYGSSGQLTRQARIRYIVRERRGDRKLLESQTTALTAMAGELTERFNAGKHASVGGVAQATTLMLQLDALLAQLLFDD